MQTLSALNASERKPATAAAPKLAPMPLLVVGFGPQGRTDGGGTISVRFNQPVGRLELDDVQRQAALPALVLSPPVEGESSFQSPELLVFKPRAALKEAHKYKVTMSGPVLAQSGAQLDAPLSWEFETPRSQLEQSFPEAAATDVARTQPLFIYLSQPATASEVQAHVSAKASPIAQPGKADQAAPAAPARAIAVSVSDATLQDVKRYGGRWFPVTKGRSFAIRPQPLWPAGSEIAVELSPGLRSAVGPLPTDIPFSVRFQTILPLKLLTTPCSVQQPCGLEPVVLKFNNPVPEKQLLRITIAPKPEQLSMDATDFGQTLGQKELTIHGVFIPGTTYHVTIPGNLTDGYGQQLGAAQVLPIVIARRPILELSETRGTLMATAAQTVGVISRHIKAFHMRAALLSDEDVATILLSPPPPRKKQDVDPVPDADADANADADDSQPEASLLTAFPWPDSGHKQIERTFNLTPSGPTDWASTALNLGELVGQLRGAVLVEVSATQAVANAAPATAKEALPRPARGLFRITDLGPVLISSLRGSLIAVPRLSDQTPVPGATVSRLLLGQPPQKLGATDRSGLLTFTAALPQPKPASAAASSKSVQSAEQQQGLYLVQDETTHDRAYLEAGGEHRGADHDPKLRPGERLILHLTSERDLYMPGERVRVVGWAALDTPYQRSGLAHPEKGTPVEWTLLDAQNRTVAALKTTTTSEGKFWAELPIPAQGSLGRFRATATLLEKQTSVSVKVEDFRVPEFSVTATVSATDLVVSQSSAAAAVPMVRASASYYFGGPVPLRAASYHHTCRTSRYRPPGVDESWQVGPLQINFKHEATPTPIQLPLVPKESQQGRVQFQPSREMTITGQPNRCSIDVTMSDASYQSHSGHTEYLVHPARYYLAIKFPGAVEAGLPLALPVQALTYDGKRVAARSVEATIERIYDEPVYRTENGRSVYDHMEHRYALVQTTQLAIAASAPGAQGAAGAKDTQLTFTPALPGTYRVKLRGSSSDDAADALTSTEFQVYRRQPHVAVQYHEPPPHLQLELSSTDVKPGDTLAVDLRSPRATPFGLLVLARNGLRDAYPMVLAPDVPSAKATKDGKSGRSHLELPVDDTWFRRVTLNALVVKRGPGQLPQVETTESSVVMTQAHRQLQVQVDAPAQAGAGAQVPVVVRVLDDKGQALAPQAVGRVALWAVDEAVLDLTGFSVTSPLAHFVPQDSAGIWTRHAFASLLLPFVPNPVDPWMTQLTGLSVGEAYGAGGGGLAGGNSSSMSPTHTRQDFQITPLFLADVALDAQGVAKVEAKLPDNLTTFRITAVASARLVDGQSPGRFGVSDARLRTTAPLIVRAAAPRLMRPGDRAEAAAIINNLGGPAGQVRLTAQLHQDPLAALRLLSPAETTLSVAEGEVVRVPFQLLAERPGPAALEFTIAMQTAGDGSGTAGAGQRLTDAIRVPIPVQLERPIMERLATYGSLTTDQPIAVPIRLPADADPQYGGLHLQASTSLLGDVEAAAKELIEYPYGCVEQTASRLVPLVALSELSRTHASKRTLAALKLGDLSEFVAAGVQRILGMQQSSGGFAYWPGAHSASPYATAYALWVLAQVEQAGYAVPAEALKRAGDYLYHQLEPKPDADGSSPEILPFAPGDPLDNMRAAIALHALSQLHRTAPVAMERLYRDRSQLPMFARAFLLLALHRTAPSDPKVAALTEELLGNLAEQQGTAQVVERIKYSLDSLFHSDARSDAIVLLALLEVRADHPIIPKLVRGLLDRRPGAAWRNTQENAYALFALAQYSQRFESQPPALATQAWMGQRSLFSVKLMASEESPHPAASVDVPIAQLLLPQAQAKGAGQDAVPIILQRTGSGRMYYRLGLDWSPIEESVKPRTQGLRITRELRNRSRTLTATDAIPPGEAVAFELTVENSAPVHYVAIDVPLPAGLEVLQTRINKQIRSIPFPGTQGSFVSHEEAWRDRVVIFADQLQPGKHVHTVYLRATTSGQYTLPPARAEAMYMPEIYGRSAAGSVQIR